MTAALVTGGAKRLGAEIARHLVSAGYAVALHCNASRADAEALAAELTASGGRAVVVQADLAEAGALAGLMDQAVQALGPLSLLVNNAALFEEDRIGTLDAALFDRQIAVNLRAPLLLSEAFARQAVAAHLPSIVNLIDQRVLKPTPGHVSYALSKTGLWAATRIMAQALAPAIRVNAVAPGPVLPNVLEGQDLFLRESAALPLARPVPPRAVADAVLYLARATSTTGQMICVDSGQHLAWRTPDVLALEAGSDQRDR